MKHVHSYQAWRQFSLISLNQNNRDSLAPYEVHFCLCTSIQFSSLGKISCGVPLPYPSCPWSILRRPESISCHPTRYQKHENRIWRMRMVCILCWYKPLSLTYFTILSGTVSSFRLFSTIRIRSLNWCLKKDVFFACFRRVILISLQCRPSLILDTDANLKGLSMRFLKWKYLSRDLGAGLRMRFVDLIPRQTLLFDSMWTFGNFFAPMKKSSIVGRQYLA